MVDAEDFQSNVFAPFGVSLIPMPHRERHCTKGQEKLLPQNWPIRWELAGLFFLARDTVAVCFWSTLRFEHLWHPFERMHTMFAKGKYMLYAALRMRYFYSRKVCPSQATQGRNQAARSSTLATIGWMRCKNVLLTPSPITFLQPPAAEETSRNFWKKFPKATWEQLLFEVLPARALHGPGLTWKPRPDHPKSIISVPGTVSGLNLSH